MRGVAEKREGDGVEGKKEMCRDRLIEENFYAALESRCYLSSSPGGLSAFQMNPITGASPLPLTNRPTPRFRQKNKQKPRFLGAFL